MPANGRRNLIRRLKVNEVLIFTLKKIGKIVPVYTMKTCKNRRRIAPFILNLSTRRHLSGDIYGQVAICPRNSAQVPIE